MIQNQINAIGDALAWIKRYKTDQYEARFIQLVKERLRLRKIETALCEHPAIAAYGESQKGKSHVMNNLLLKDGRPYFVETPQGNKDFIAQINPPTLGNEATGVVTRFSSFEMPDGTISPRYRAEHPVLLKMLSPADMAMILCDSYFNDVNKPDMPEKEAINEFVAGLKERYAESTAQEDAPVIEDDMLDMYYYLKNHIGSRADRYYNSQYFSTMGHIVRQIPVGDLADAFSILWNRNQDITNLYARLVRAHQSIGFAREAYCDIDAVLNDRNTIMAVVCLKGLKESEWNALQSDEERYARVYYKDVHGQEKVLDKFPKCELSALCAEVVFKIDAKSLDTDVHYDLSSIPSESQNCISRNGVRKDILHTNDLLDFPGARPRENYPANALELDIMVKRGKVAYLFHKYCEEHLINVFMFCHDQQNVGVTEMYDLIAKWVQAYVGRTPEERLATIAKTKVPPIFIIATKFNMDMVEVADKVLNEPRQLNERWTNRFQKILWNEAVKGDTPDKETGDCWFKNFTGQNKPFDNSFLLRDFKYSSDIGAGGKLYHGYDPGKDGSREETMLMTADYYDNMRHTFIQNPHVGQFFSNPALAWDVATTRNNDGAQYIIERLGIVAHNLMSARTSQLQAHINDSVKRVVALLKDYYINEDADELMRQNVRKAKKVMREMDFSVQRDNYFFGHLLENFQVSEREVYGILHELINSSALTEEVNNFTGVEVFMKRYGARLNACNSIDEKWEVLMDELVMDTREEVVDYMTRHGIDPNAIISPMSKKKVNSVIIADRIMEMWETKMRSSEILNAFTGENAFDSIVMASLTDNMITTARQLNLAEHLAETIAEYVNVLVVSTINESLVSDLMATEVNDFVNDLGFHYRQQKEVESLKRLADELHLSCFDSILSQRKETYTEEELSAMFDEFNETGYALTPSFAQAYQQWIEYVTVSFISKVSVGDYNRQANHLMGEILNKVQQVPVL